MHAITLSSDNNKSPSEYACYPALAMKDASTRETVAPAPRSEHAACARGSHVVIHGGRDAKGHPIDDSCIWLWDSNALSWSRIRAPSQIGKALAPRFGHRIFLDEAQDVLVLHGGWTAPGQPESTETWIYTFDTLAWTELPAAPAAAAASAFVDNVLYTISKGTHTPGAVQYLDIKSKATDREKPDAMEWKTVEFPANPLVPGPQPRVGGALVPVTTGLGRQYLIYLLGSHAGDDNQTREFYSDIWSLQLPSREYSAAAIKDAIRDKLPRVESGELSWAEVEILPETEVKTEGKAHPGPRGFFGADALGDNGVVFWGGLDGSGNEGDGWLLQIK